MAGARGRPLPALSSVLYVTGEGGPTLVVREVTDEGMREVRDVGGGK